MHCRAMACLTATLLPLLLASTAPVHAQTPPAAPVPAAAVNPALEAARLAFEAMAEPDRAAIQDALVWTGDYSGPLDGAFGRGSFNAIQAFEKRAKLVVDGILPPPERTALLAAGTQVKTAERFKIGPDKPTGITIGLPLARLGAPKATPDGNAYAAADGKVRVVTRVFNNIDLPSLFDLLKTERPGVKITYAVLRADWLVVTSETDKTRSYIRVGVPVAGGAPRGFQLDYDKTLGPQLDRISVAMSNSFRPDAAPTATPVAQTPQPPAGPPTAAAGPATTRLISGIRVSTELVATSAPALKACPGASIAGQPVVVAREAEGVALLQLAGKQPQAGASVPVQPGMAAVVLGFSAEGGTPRLVASSGEFVTGAKGMRVLAGIQPGSAGAAVFTRAGRLVGVLEAGPDERTRIAGLVTPARAYAMLPVKESVSAAGSDSTVLSVGQIVATSAAALVAIRCGN